MVVLCNVLVYTAVLTWFAKSADLSALNCACVDAGDASPLVVITGHGYKCDGTLA